MNPYPPQVGQTAPTQTVYPWRTTVRTIFQFGFALVSLVPVVLIGAHLDATAAGAQVIVVGATITRVMAIPAVEQFLQNWAPWLSAHPPLR
jgi:hypothetical protein